MFGFIKVVYALRSEIKVRKAVNSKLAHINNVMGDMIKELERANAFLVENLASITGERDAAVRKVGFSKLVQTKEASEQSEIKKVRDTFAAMDKAIRRRNEIIEALTGAAIDMDAQISEMRGCQEGIKNTIKWAAQDRAAGAILDFFSLPSVARMNRADKDALVKAIADIADKI